MKDKDEFKPLTRLDQWIISIGHSVSIVFLLCSLIIIFEIISRYVFNSPTFWVHETTVLLCSLLFLYSGSYTLATNRHIRITMIYDMLPARWQHVMDIFITTMSIFYSTLMLIAAYTVAKSALFTPWGTFRLETSASAWDPPIPAIVKTFLFIVLLIMSIQYILHLIVYIKGKKNV